MTITEILTGKDEFKGLMPLIMEFCHLQKYEEEQINHIQHIVDFIVARSKGEVPTGARFIRDFVRKHPFYKKDSKISPCLSQMLTVQIIKLNQDIQGCKCEEDTNSDSEQGVNCREEMLKQIQDFEETTETETEQEESKNEQTVSVDEAVKDMGEIVEGYKKAMMHLNVEANDEFSPTKVMKK